MIKKIKSATILMVITLAMTAIFACSGVESVDSTEHLGQSASNLQALYNAQMLALHPVAWWKLDETSNPIADSSGNGHSGALWNLSNDGLGTYGRSGAANIGGTSVHFGYVDPIDGMAKTAPIVGG
jgi:hypothetical protein